jgi:hypothetical protein
MPANTNFLLGYGETLTEPATQPPKKAEKHPPYSFLEAKSRVIPMIQAAAAEIRSLSPLACPGDQAVAVLTLHPEYLAKSYFPLALLQSLRLDSVGSRPTIVKPEKWSRKGEPSATDSTDLFIAGPRDAFIGWASGLPHWTEQIAGAENLVAIEQLRSQRPKDRIQPIRSNAKEVPLEIVLHASAQRASNFILEGFQAFLRSLELKADFDRRFHVGGLCFMPMKAPIEAIPKVAEFSFLRVIRGMPRLRMLNPIVRSLPTPGFQCALPNAAALGTATRAAIFDGGLDPKSPLARWVQPIDPPGIGNSLPGYLEHGHQVTSAFLFGSLKSGAALPPPFTNAEHYRVLDDVSANDPDELYDVLERIRGVLENTPYDFISLSIGPDLPVEDTEVHGWTAFFDEHLADGTTLAVIAVGNGGENDHQTQQDRIQIPADSVNALSVGASNSAGTNWQRAPYSSIGPGRSPGVVKPDVIAFGGCPSEPFWIVDPSDPAKAAATMGTSFATPATLRLCIGVRTYLGQVVTPLATKALLVHCAEDGTGNRPEHGWGRIPADLNDLILCPDATARVLYQGELAPKKYLRARIPVPDESMAGLVTITATFCYATLTDPQNPGNYTRSGLDVVFRPHDEEPHAGAEHPTSSTFFRKSEFSVEQDLRRDAHKWETTLHRERRMRGNSLHNPVFDIHYTPRDGGGPSAAPPKIRYALVVSVSAPKTQDLYNKIVRRYRTLIRPLQPVLTIPIRT